MHKAKRRSKKSLTHLDSHNRRNKTMVKEIKLNGVADIKELNRIATSYPSDVGIHSETTIVDAKSLLGLMTLDFSKPVLCVTEDEYFYKRIKNFLA